MVSLWQFGRPSLSPQPLRIYIQGVSRTVPSTSSPICPWRHGSARVFHTRGGGHVSYGAIPGHVAAPLSTGHATGEPGSLPSLARRNCSACSCSEGPSLSSVPSGGVAVGTSRGVACLEVSLEPMGLPSADCVVEVKSSPLLVGCGNISSGSEPR